MPELASPSLTPAPRRTLAAAAAPDVEIVVPVHNEAAGLERSVRRLHRFLSDGFPFSWRIVIADNASVDATPEIARRLALTLPSVRHLRLGQKGAAVRCAPPGRPARRRSSPTWTSTSRPTCAGCCHWSRH